MASYFASASVGDGTILKSVDPDGQIKGYSTLSRMRVRDRCSLRLRHGRTGQIRQVSGRPGGGDEAQTGLITRRVAWGCCPLARVRIQSTQSVADRIGMVSLGSFHKRDECRSPRFVANWSPCLSNRTC